MKTYTYAQFRNAGHSPASALRASKVCREFAALEASDLVRFVVEDEQENYFSVYGEPEGYINQHGKRISAEQERADIVASIELNGCFYMRSEFRGSVDAEWQHADSCGMLTGYRRVTDMLDCQIAIDLASAAIDAVEAQAFAPSL